MGRRAKKRQQRARRGITATRKPAVNIVMPVYGEPDFLKCCLESLYAHDAGVDYILTLVDDVSPPDVEMGWVYDLAQSQPSTGHFLGTQVIYHRENKGFAATCNTGARAGKAPWILLLNTDTLIVHDGWLAAMVAEGEDEKVGVVGCLLTFFPEDHPLYKEHPLHPPEAVQHAGVAFDIVGRPYHIFAGWSAGHPKVAQRREMNCVTGACLMARQLLWRRLGGLEESYIRGNFEDVEFCIRARLEGYKVIYTPKAHLRHYAGGSGNSEMAKRNATLFQLRMGEAVEFDEWRYW